MLELASQSLRLWFNGVDTYIARDVEHARELMLAQVGHVDDVASVDDWSEDTRDVLTIGDDELGTRTKARVEWIAENGAGFLCSTEW